MKALRVILGIFAALVLLFLFLPLLASPTPTGAVLRKLPFGWWSFLNRNIPQLTYDWGLIATGMICSIGALIVGNWFMRALFQQLYKPRSPKEPVRTWKWSWSVGIYAAIWILFLIAFGATGLLRHTTWLIESNEPWYEERLNARLELRMADGQVQQLLIETDSDLEKSRQAIMVERRYRRERRPLCEDYNIILYGDGSNQVAAYLIIPRNPKLLAKGHFAGWVPGDQDSIHPLSELQGTISMLDAKFPGGK